MGLIHRCHREPIRASGRMLPKSLARSGVPCCSWCWANTSLLNLETSKFAGHSCRQALHDKQRSSVSRRSGSLKFGSEGATIASRSALPRPRVACRSSRVAPRRAHRSSGFFATESIAIAGSGGGRQALRPVPERADLRLGKRLMASVNTKGDQSWSGLDDVLLVQPLFRIEQHFDLAEGFYDLRAEHLVHHLGPDAPISMLARDGATVFNHKLRQISGQGCPMFLFRILSKIKSGSHMQQANRRVGVPDGLALLLLQSAGKSPSECGVLLEGYGVVFKTSDGHLAGGWFSDQSQPFFPKSPEQLGFDGVGWFVERDSLLLEQVFGRCGALIVIFQIDQCTIGRHLVEDGGEATLPLGRLMTLASISSTAAGSVPTRCNKASHAASTSAKDASSNSVRWGAGTN